MSLDTASSSATKPAAPAASTASEAGFSAPTSRRITRSGGTFASCSTGGRPKPISSVKPTPTPNIAGHRLGGGSSARTSPASSQMKTWWTAKPMRDAGDARQQADQRELDQVLQRDRPLRQAEHAQHRAVVEVAAREVARRDADRDGRQQRGEQRDEVQELLGAVERLPHFGPAVGERLDAQPAHARRP